MWPQPLPNARPPQEPPEPRAMPDFLRSPFADGPAVNVTDLSIRLVVAVILGIGVSWVYRATRNRAEVAPTFPATLVLLSVLIAMSTQVIGDNVARAFSLVGALSIVRFRTVVRDTQDTAFVIFAVVVGMAVGAHNLITGGIGLVIVAAAAFIMRPRAAAMVVASPPFLLHLRVGLGHDIEALVGATLDAHLNDRQMVSISTAKQGLVVDVSYQGTLRNVNKAEELVKALNRTDGVQGVELVRQAPADI
jgi:hypothetical protein